MKILSIRIKNLASFSGEHFIDFEANPLASTGLIAITGKTGAGKSTILDAMCLALFNRIPRLKGSEGKIKDVDGSELNTNAPQTILRKGSSSGFSELHFIAQDQKCYCARWELKRARDKSNGKLSDVKRSLICVSDGATIATSRTQVEQHIRQITHLSFEQFTRAVLLAQSEVTAFLKAKDAERGELLEYLTNASSGGKIGEMAYRKTAEIAKKRKDIENVIGHISLLSEDDVNAIKNNFILSQKNLSDTEQHLSQLKDHQQWYMRRNELEVQIQQRQHTHDEALHSYEALTFDQQRLQQLETFADVRPTVMQKQNAQQQQQQLVPQLDQLNSSFQTIADDFQQQQQHYQHIEQILQTAQQFEKDHQKTLHTIRNGVRERDFFAKEYKQNETELKNLVDQVTPLSQQLSAQQQHILDLENQRQQLNTQLSTATFTAQLDKGLEQHIQSFKRFILKYQPFEEKTGHLSTLEKQLEQQQNQQRELQKKLGDTSQLEAQIQHLRQQREYILQRCNHVDFLHPQIQKWLESEKDLSPLLHIQHIHTQDIQERQQHIQQSEKNHHDAQQQRITLQDMLQQQRLLHAENVEKLRDTLISGQPCVVCGSLQHPYQQEESNLSKELFLLQQQQEKNAIQQEQHYFDQLQQLKNDQQKAELELQQAQFQEKQLKERLNNTALDLSERIKQAKIKVDLKQDAEKVMAMLQHEKNQIMQQQQQLDAQLNEQLIQQKQQQSLATAIHEQQQQVQHARQMLSELDFIIDELPPEQQQHWQKQPLQLAEQCLTQFQSRFALLQQQQKLQQQFEQQQHQHHLVQQQHQHVTHVIHDLQHKQNRVKQQAQDNNLFVIQLIEKISAESIKTPQDWLIQYDQGYQHKQQEYQNSKDAFEQCRQHFDRHKQQLDQLKTQHQQFKQQAEAAEIHLQRWIQQHPEFNAEYIDSLMHISHEEMQQLRQHIQHQQRQYHDAMTALKTIQEALTQHQQTQPEADLNQLEQHLTEQNVHLISVKQQTDDLRLQLEIHQQNATKQQQFIKQIEEIQQEENRWDKISSVMGDAKGKRFRDYAQQYHLDILLEYANQQLQQLSQRYTLQRLDDSLSLAIIDHDMDGEIRSVASLSGGESFLTALALSLAIANMASGELKIESLFIDEGFGTLDASSLHIVMDALDRLQSQGRKVVLISHIAEMHERIPVQIQVQPLGSGASRIQIIG